jgi:N-acetylmuramoyl-L-alanine amidase
MPSVIVETHHALDLEENARWLEPHTWDAFADTLAAALDDALRAPGSGAKPGARAVR